MALILYCRLCFEGFRHQGGTLPEVCPRCEKPVDEWLTYDNLPPPRVAWELTTKDANLLRALWIDPEVGPLAGTVES